MGFKDRIKRVKRAWADDTDEDAKGSKQAEVSDFLISGPVLDAYFEAKIDQMLQARALADSKPVLASLALTPVQRKAAERKIARLQKHSRQTAFVMLFLAAFFALMIEVLGSYSISYLGNRENSRVPAWHWLQFNLNTADMVAVLVGMLILIATLNIAIVIRPSVDSKDDAPMLAWVQASTRIANTTAVLAGFFALVQWTNPSVRADAGSGAAIVILAALCVFLAANIRSWTDHEIAIQISLKENLEIEISIKSALDSIKVQRKEGHKTSRWILFSSLAVRSLVLTAVPIGFLSWLFAANGTKHVVLAITVLAIFFWGYNICGLHSVTDRSYGKAVKDDFKVFISWIYMVYGFVLWFYLIVILAYVKLPHLHWLVLPLAISAGLSLIGVYFRPKPGKTAQRRLAYRLELAEVKIQSRIDELRLDAPAAEADAENRDTDTQVPST